MRPACVQAAACASAGGVGGLLLRCVCLLSGSGGRACCARCSHGHLACAPMFGCSPPPSPTLSPSLQHTHTPGCYLAVKGQVDVAGALQRVGLMSPKEEDVPPEEQGWVRRMLEGSSSSLALAFIANKALIPVRAPITIALTPPVARCVCVPSWRGPVRPARWGGVLLGVPGRRASEAPGQQPAARPATAHSSLRRFLQRMRGRSL